MSSLGVYVPVKLLLMKSTPAFSKSKVGSSTVAGGGKRSGFIDHVKSTVAAKQKPLSGMSGFKGGGKTSGSLPPKQAPSFKSHSGAAGKSVPAFSKKKI